MLILTDIPNKSYFFKLSYNKLSCDSSVGKATGYGQDVWCSTPGRGKNFLFSTASRPALRPTQPPLQYVLRVNSPELKRPGREADRSPSSSVEDKNDGAIPPPHICGA
jgi:hypothetical protein